jgi:ribosomal protein S18 acetylase RimI-like enzyme
MNIAAFAGGVLSKAIGVPGPGGQPWRPGVDLFGFNIRPAASGDFKRLAKLFDELDEFHRRGRPDLSGKPQGPAREPEEIEALIAGPDSTILVAEDSAFPHLIGLATVRVRETPALPFQPSRRIAEIAHLGVARHARRHGIGRALMREAQAFAAVRDATAVELSVHEFNTGAIAFYEALGFHPLTRRLGMRLAG